MTFKIDRRLLIYLSVGFIVATIIGTITHEAGHYFVAKCLGYNARIDYQSTWLTPSSVSGKVMNSQEHFLFTLGGPIETMLTGTIGLALLFQFRKSFQAAKQLSFRQWVIVFISLFWLRQTANFFVWIMIYLFNGHFSLRGDEIKLANYLNLPFWTIAFLTAIIGGFVLMIVVFKFIPLKQRFTFIISGLVGGVAGYLFWLEFFGRIIMP